MVDWRKPMTQSYDYYLVDPHTWTDTKRLTTIKSSSISRDLSADTLGSASFTIDGLLDESYIRVYLVVEQNGVRSKHPLGTFLVQTPSYDYDGMVKSSTLDAYTPLIELKENKPPLGYYVPEGDNIMRWAYLLTDEHMRGPVVESVNEEHKVYKDFVANEDDTWINFISDLMENANYSYGLDETGQVIFEPYTKLEAMQPVWTFDDGNSSILYPKITYERDLYGIPNVVEVIYTNEHQNYTVRVSNDDPNSPVSTVNRGREILYRDTDPKFPGIPSEPMVQEYANKLLKKVSTLKCTITYKHGYCPVRLGDCVRLDYQRSGISGVKAQVIKQDISCSTACSVSETAVFIKHMWGGDI